MTDYRALCAELLEKYDLEWRARERIKAALDQSEPVGPTDEELVRVYQAAYQPAWERGEFHGCHVDGLRAVLARYARPTIEPEGP